MFCKFYDDVLLTIIICWSNPVNLSTSYTVTLGSCKSPFIMSITEFVKNASVSFLRLLIPSITRPGRREYCSWSCNFSRNTFVTWFARGSCGSKTTTLLSRWPSFLSRYVIFSFYFVMVSLSKTSSRCILCIAGFTWQHVACLSFLFIMQWLWEARFFLLLWCRSGVFGFWS